jgi:hypothetical protein
MAEVDYVQGQGSFCGLYVQIGCRATLFPFPRTWLRSSKVKNDWRSTSILYIFGRGVYAQRQLHRCLLVQEPGSSVSIESDYGLDDWAIGVRSLAEAKNFSSSLCVQTGSRAHPASYTMGTEGPFPGAKRGRGVTLTTKPHLVPRSRMSRSYSSSPLKRHHGV